MFSFNARFLIQLLVTAFAVPVDARPGAPFMHEIPRRAPASDAVAQKADTHYHGAENGRPDSHGTGVITISGSLLH